MLSRIIAALLLISALVAMGSHPRPPGVELADTCLDESRIPLQERELLRHIKAVLEQSQGITCKKLEVGSWRDVVADSQLSPTKVRHAYRLLRKGEKEYEALLSLDFEGTRTRSLRERLDLRRKMLARTNACLSMASRALTGPNGERLEIRAVNSSPMSASAPPRSAIRISSDIKRENAGHWNEATPCPVIVHEVMHLMGLCDEYRETSRGYVRIRDPKTGKEEVKRVDDGAQFPLYDCRSFGPADSLMEDQWSAFAAAFPAKIQRIHCDNESCKAQVRREMAASPQANLESVCRKAGCIFDAPWSLWEAPPVPDQIRNGLIETSRGLALITNAEAAPTRPLLYPSQFRALIEPGCLSNLNFYLCSAEAYRTSKATNPKGDGCWYPEKRKSCSDPSWVSGK